MLGLHKCKTDEELMRLLYLGVSESKSYVLLMRMTNWYPEFTRQDMTKKREIREHVREHFEKLLIGPIDGEEEVVLSDMRLRYMLGVLFLEMPRSDIASSQGWEMMLI